jgi:hypothetical protein
MDYFAFTHPGSNPTMDRFGNSLLPTGGDKWHLVKDDTTVDTSWHILNRTTVDTSWHIHPAVVEYIQQFMLSYTRSEFPIRALQTSFDVNPIITNFNVADVIQGAVKLLPMARPTFKVNLIQTNFSLRAPITRNFVITRVNDNTRTP